MCVHMATLNVIFPFFTAIFLNITLTLLKSFYNSNVVSLHVCRLNQHSAKCKDMRTPPLSTTSNWRKRKTASLLPLAAGPMSTLTPSAVTKKKKSGSGQPATVCGVSDRFLVSFIPLPCSMRDTRQSKNTPVAHTPNTH